MKLNIVATPTGPCIAPELLLKFVIKKCKEIIEQNRKNLPRIWVALTLAAVSPDEEFYTDLKQVVSSCASPETILGMCQNIFLPSLNRLEGVETPEWAKPEEKYPAAQERDYKRLLLYALREGEKMLVDEDYEFCRVFESLCWIGLQFYDFRLCQFESVRQSFQDDPENLVRRGVKIIRAAAGVNPRNKN